MAGAQPGTLQSRREVESTARARASGTVWQMKSTQHELPRIDQKRQEPAPAFIDVNSDCQSIVVNAPVAEVYRRCLQFEEFPRFITSIKKVEKINDTRFSCASMINGQKVKTVITIMMRIPDRRIAWKGVSDQFVGLKITRDFNSTAVLASYDLDSFSNLILDRRHEVGQEKYFSTTLFRGLADRGRLCVQLSMRHVPFWQGTIVNEHGTILSEFDKRFGRSGDITRKHD